MDAASGPLAHHSVLTRVIVKFLFNAHPRAAMTAGGKLAVLSLAMCVPLSHTSNPVSEILCANAVLIQ